jgi:translation initiation factor IF-3
LFKGPRINEKIRVPEVRLIGPDGTQMGIFQTRDAIAKAKEMGYDLVEVSPNARPPVCKMLDWGKYRYEQSKKEREGRKKQAVIHIKEIQLRPSTGEHYVMEEGDKVKITIKFKGREIAHPEHGFEMVERALKELEGKGVVEQRPLRDGKTISAVIAPLKKKQA